jgi:hypothetical protein
VDPVVDPAILAWPNPPILLTQPAGCQEVSHGKAEKLGLQCSLFDL